MQIKIKVGMGPADSSIEVDGVLMQGVVSIGFAMSARRDNPPFVDLRLMGEVEIEGEFDEQEILVVKRDHPVPFWRKPDAKSDEIAADRGSDDGGRELGGLPAGGAADQAPPNTA